MMCQDLLESILEGVAKPFDDAISEKGDELKLSGVNANVLDELETLHWERTGALVSKAFEVGLELGKVLGRLDIKKSS